MPTALVGEHQRTVACHKETEGDQERVQQRSVIGILQVLMIELPVSRKRMAGMAEHLELALVEGRAKLAELFGAKVVAKGSHVVAVESEHHAAMARAVEP